jgi:hypothetical protein
MDLELEELRIDDEEAVGRVGILFEVVLVILLCPVKGLERNDFGGDRLAEFYLLRLLGGHGEPLLLRSFVEDDRAILRADVGALLVEGGRIMDVPKNIEQLLIGDFRRVVGDPDDFGVAGLVAADILVGRVHGMAAGVAADDVGDSTEFFEERLGAPETAHAEGGGLKARRRRGWRARSVGADGRDGNQEGDEKSEKAKGDHDFSTAGRRAAYAHLSQWS